MSEPKWSLKVHFQSWKYKNRGTLRRQICGFKSITEVTSRWTLNSSQSSAEQSDQNMETNWSNQKYFQLNERMSSEVTQRRTEIKVATLLAVRLKIQAWILVFTSFNGDWSSCEYLTETSWFVCVNNSNQIKQAWTWAERWTHKQTWA